MMPSFRPSRAEQIQALTQFLSSAFGVDELRRLIAFNFGDDGQKIIDNVNFRDPKASVVAGLVDVLVEQRVLPSLWAALYADRQRRAAEIAKLERLFMWHHVPRSQKIKILIAFTDVDPSRPLDLEGELAAIQKEVDGAPHKDQFEIVVRKAASWDDFRNAVLEERPHVVQFSGHGDSKGTFVFRDADGGPDMTVSAAMFAGLMTVQQSDISLVVLNACYSDVVAERLRPKIDRVIGMRKAIYDDAAIRFSSILYRSLAQGCAFGEAFEVARNELIRLESELGPRLR